MKDFFFIINPVSGGGKGAKSIRQIQDWIDFHSLPAEICFTAHPGHAIQLARKAAEDGYSKIVAVGGDGTLHEVVNGIAPFSKEERPSLGILSVGTGGDFYRTLREEFSIKKNLDWFLDPREVFVDFGMASLEEKQGSKQRYFINTADVGLSGEVVRRVHASGKHLGSLEYLRATLSAAFSYRAPRVRIRGIPYPHRPWEGELLQLVVANGRYFGGGMCVAPEAKIQDQAFDLLLVEKISYLRLLREFPQIYLKHRIRHPKAHYGRGTKIQVEGVEGEIPVEMDGEYYPAFGVSFELIPQGLKILVP